MFTPAIYSLLNLDLKGLPDSEYAFLNVESGIYLYSKDETLLNTETTDKGYQEILRRIQEKGDAQTGTYSTGTRSCRQKPLA